MLTLKHADACCTIHPELGGGLTRWTIGDQPLLRTADAASIENGDLLGMSTFPLVPYSNRIKHGQFEWDGQRFQLKPNFAPELHAIHGVGWQRAWTVSELTDSAATLTLKHSADENWPWPFEAEQRITIDDSRLVLALSVRNCADHAVPLAFGHHPYFDAVGASLRFAASSVWIAGTDSLAIQPVVPQGQFDFTEFAPVEGRDIDHCYAGIRGTTHIIWRDRPLALEIVSTPLLDAAVVYIPDKGSAFCFEPVPHINNALNVPGGHPQMPVVPEGERFAVTITLRAFPR
jgi:aldose 1-epimerase